MAQVAAAFAENSFKDLRDFFSAPAFSGPSQQCDMKEFKEFWMSCSSEDKAYFKSVRLV